MQSSRCGKSPNEPSRVSATMRETPVFSAKISNGRRTLRFMSVGCCMFHLRFSFRLGFRLRIGRSFGLGAGGGRRIARRFGFGPTLGFSYGLAGFAFSFRFVNRPYHVERPFRVVFQFIAQDAFAAIERVFEADEFSLDAAKLL